LLWFYRSEREMWKRVFREAIARQPWSTITSKRWSSTSPTSISAAVDTLLLRSLKEHYLQVSKMNPPPVREHKLYLKTLLGFCFSLKSKTLFLFLLLKEPHEEFRVLDREILAYVSSTGCLD